VSVKPSLAIQRRINASPAKLYSAWTEPAKIALWWSAKPNETTLAEVDARVGGRFHIVYRTAQGEENSVSGVYREMRPNEKLVFTWAWRSTPERESLVTIELKPEGAGTLLMLTHENFFDEAARDRHHQGWDRVLASLEGFLLAS
jgi:uncharacterized protein YndB with AHSA1/START domain